MMSPEGVAGARDDLFSEYVLDDCYDEMFDRSGIPREPYAALHRRLLELSPAELRHRQQDADSAFLHQGVTFTVYGDDQGTERIFPYDLLPRIITAREWDTIERGATTPTCLRREASFAAKRRACSPCSSPCRCPTRRFAQSA
jgi:hypothetical protein